MWCTSPQRGNRTANRESPSVGEPFLLQYLLRAFVLVMCLQNSLGKNTGPSTTAWKHWQDFDGQPQAFSVHMPWDFHYWKGRDLLLWILQSLKRDTSKLIADTNALKKIPLHSLSSQRTSQFQTRFTWGISFLVSCSSAWSRGLVRAQCRALNPKHTTR